MTHLTPANPAIADRLRAISRASVFALVALVAIAWSTASPSREHVADVPAGEDCASACVEPTPHVGPRATDLTPPHAESGESIGEEEPEEPCRATAPQAFALDAHPRRCRGDGVPTRPESGPLDGGPAVRGPPSA